jgi:hypothetical protein
MIKRALVLETIRNSNPHNTFHIVFYTETGDRHELESACLASNVHKTPRHIKNQDKKFKQSLTQPNLDETESNRYDTFNIFDTITKQIRKVNIELIPIFNHTAVSL